MSDPRQQSRNAQAIKFGLLAARSADAISRATAQEVLSDEDREILAKAEGFLRQAADGAAFVVAGQQGGGSAIGSVEALGYALKPIQSLDELLKGRAAPEVFGELAQAVSQIAAGNVAAVDVDVLTSVKTFFGRLYGSLIGLIEHNRLQPAPSGHGRRAIVGQRA